MVYISIIRFWGTYGEPKVPLEIPHLGTFGMLFTTNWIVCKWPDLGNFGDHVRLLTATWSHFRSNRTLTKGLQRAGMVVVAVPGGKSRFSQLLHYPVPTGSALPKYNVGYVCVSLVQRLKGNELQQQRLSSRPSFNQLIVKFSLFTRRKKGIRARKAQREAILGTFEKSGLIEQTRGGRSRSACKQEKVL